MNTDAKQECRDARKHLDCRGLSLYLQVAKSYQFYFYR
jgi:hypothetical protein